MLPDITKSSSWSTKQAWSWYQDQRLVIGFNYLPSTAVNSTEMWQNNDFDPVTIAKELSWAASYGYNTARVFLQFLVWQDDPQGYLDRFEQFLKIAHQNNIKIMPVFFDDCAFSNLEPYLGVQNAPVPLVHNSGWTPSPGTTYTDNPMSYKQLEQFVDAFLSAHRTDERILLWDMYNEPGNSNRGARNLYLLEESFRWARKWQPIQPLTAGVWGMENGSAVEGTIFNDLKALELSDIITFHHYGDSAAVDKTLKKYESLGYPVICTEWLARVFFESYIETVLPVFKEHNAGSIHWGLVNGKTQTHIPWNHDKSKGEPTIWFHDVLHRDGTPYDEREMELIKQVSRQSRKEIS